MASSIPASRFPVPAHELVEREWLRRMASGEIAGLRQLYDQHSPRVYGFAYRLLGDAGEAEEATQDVFLRVWHRAASYDPAKGSPWTWLVMMTRSVCIDRLRRRRARRDAEAPLGDFETRDPAVQPESDRGQIVSLLDHLRPIERLCLQAVFLEGRTHEETAAHTGIALGSVKTHIRRSLLKLRQILTSHDS